MSSGLPINTFSQAAEYRKRYLATLALEAQNDAYNLQANQVYRQTGQPSRPPDTRTTTEKLADLERMKVDLRAGLMAITDGTQANETIEQLTPDEVIFATQQLPAITAELKPRFATGVPANALLAYIRALRRKFLQTNGVSFSAQESTAQQILNAIQAGQNVLNAPGGPFAIGQGGAGGPPGGGPPIGPGGINPNPPPIDAEAQRRAAEDAEQQRIMMEQQQRRRDDVRRRAEDFLATGNVPLNTLPREVQDMVNQIRAERGEGGAAGEALMLGRFKQEFRQGAGMFGPDSIQEWNDYPVPNAFPGFPDNETFAKEFLKMWAQAQVPEVQAEFANGWQRKKSLSALKTALTPGVVLKLADNPPIDEDAWSEQGRLGTNNPAEIELISRTPSRGPSRAPSIGTATELEEFMGATTNPSQTASNPEEGRRKIGGISSSVMFMEQVMNGQVSQREGVSMVTNFLERNNLLDYLVGPQGQNISPSQIQYTQGKAMSNKFDIDETNLRTLIIQVRGFGMKPKSMVMRRVGEPASRYPRGREILGYGLKIPKPTITKKPIQIDMNKGLAYNSAPSYVSFGKYAINPNKLSSGVFEIKTMKGGLVVKYPTRKLSPNLSKILNRMIGGRMPDNYDFQEMDLEDQNFLFNLAKDAKIMDRINLPTPKLSKDGEEQNRFEILKGQIMAGNDSKELVKEFKQMLVRFSNDGRIKKTEAREILLDLAALGY